MPLRIANALLLVAAALVLTGTLSFLLGSGSWSWSAVSNGIWWYTSQRWAAHPLLTGMLGVTLLFGLGLALVLLRSWLRFRTVAPEPPLPLPPQDAGKQLFLIRRRLDREIARARAEPERVLDALLGVMVDNDSEELQLKTGPMVVDVQLVIAGELKPISTMSLPLYQQVLDLLRLVIGLDQEQGTGKVELRSSWRVDLLEIKLAAGAHGIDASVWLLEETTAAEEASRQVSRQARAAAPDHRGRLRRLRSSPSTLLRLERARLPDMRSGELSVPVGEHDINDIRSSLHYGLNATAEHEIAPLVKWDRQRPIPPAEAWLRLLFACCAVLFTLAYFWQAYAWTGHKITTGQPTAPWQDVTLLIESDPTDARVSLDGEQVGHTPLRISRPCKGRKIQLLVQANGHRAWQWGGFCPQQGQLKLQAQLQPR